MDDEPGTLEAVETGAGGMDFTASAGRFAVTVTLDRSQVENLVDVLGAWLDVTAVSV